MTLQAEARIDAGSSVSFRDATFLAIFAWSWIPTPIFPDLGSNATFENADGQFFFTYLSYATLAALSLYFLWATDRPALKSVCTPSNLIALGWILVACLASQDPATSIKRAAMLVFVATCCLSLFLLPKDRAGLERLLSIVAFFVLGACYFGVIFLPQYSIHQPTDLGEIQLSGDWRGFYGHKNQASAVFSVTTLFGIFLMRSERKIEGAAIFILSLIFVLASGGKSSTGILFLTIALSYFVGKARNFALFLLLAFAPLLLINAVGVGAAIVPELGALAASLPFDTSFTGRSDIWSFAAPKAMEKLALGYGFLVFWMTPSLKFGMERVDMWAGAAAHAHNGYLDSVLSMGLPGLFITLWALALQPARDFNQALKRDEEPALTMLLVQIWMFHLYLGSLESFFYDRAVPQWIAMLFAIFGGRYLAEFRLRR